MATIDRSQYIMSDENVKGVDYATKWDSTSSELDCYVSKGVDFICRYYAPDTSSSDKILTRSEAQDIINNGMDVVPVYQGSNNTASEFTRENGYNDGLDAISQAESLGQPKNTAIYFAVDFDAKYDIAAIKSYFSGVSDAFFEYEKYNGGQSWLVGVYGGYDTVKELHNYSGVTKTWQANAWSFDASGNFQNYRYRNIFQHTTDVEDYCPNNFLTDINASDGTHGGFSYLV